MSESFGFHGLIPLYLELSLLVLVVSVPLSVPNSFDNSLIPLVALSKWSSSSSSGEGSELAERGKLRERV